MMNLLFEGHHFRFSFSVSFSTLHFTHVLWLDTILSVQIVLEKLNYFHGVSL